MDPLNKIFPNPIVKKSPQTYEKYFIGARLCILEDQGEWFLYVLQCNGDVGYRDYDIKCDRLLKAIKT